MRILEEQPIEQIATCKNCGTKFAYDLIEDEDVMYTKYNGKYVLCPKCGEEICLESFEPMSFPKAYFYFGNGSKIDDETIRQDTIRGIKYLEQNPDDPYWFTCCGDTCICIYRVDDGDGTNEDDMYYEVMVCKNYWNLMVEKKEAKEIVW